MFDLTQLIVPVYAAVSGGTVDTSSWQPENFKGLIEIAVRTLFIVGGVAFVILFLIGAIRYITSGGDVKAVDGAKKNITAAIVGVLILASVYTVAWFFNKALGAPTFGGIVSWTGVRGVPGTPGTSFRGDYAMCPSAIMSYKPSCTVSPNLTPCCVSTQDCINMKIVKDNAPTCVTECSTSSAACSSGSGQINWSCWKDWINGDITNRLPIADDMCVNCNLCGN
ncbi:hypothetical protein KJ664_00135 [Patescibacteria group bacterium]|nr:hypothetical protein [Patescibacteria group bacterium]